MPHSILKKSKPPSTTLPNPPVARPQDERNKETALYHARLLQQRKDVEALILASTETLLDLPSSPSADPAYPSSSDALLAKAALKPFQRSDYDVLIEERNINEQCGYVLCPRHNKKQDTKARYRILQDRSKASKDLKFVSRQSLEKWCSDDCGKRALYIKVQLDEEPSWTRADPSSGEIAFLQDSQTDQAHWSSDTDLVRNLLNLDISGGEDQFAERMKALAIDRGDGSAPNRLRGLGELDLREKAKTVGKCLPPASTNRHSEIGGKFDSIEGYTPRSWDKDITAAKKIDDEEDLMPTI